MLKCFSLLFLLLFLSSCFKYRNLISDAKDNKDSHPEERIFDGEIEPPFPQSLGNNETLLGIDVNKNGVRDDIDVWINYVGLNRNHRMALRSLYKTLANMIITGNENNLELIQKAARNFNDAQNCASWMEIGQYSRVEEKPSFELLQLVYNNNARERTLKNINTHSVEYSSNIKNLKNDEEYKLCNFAVDYPDEINEHNRLYREKLNSSFIK